MFDAALRQIGDVMGKAQTPDGKMIETDQKGRNSFDRDGGGFMLFRSDLTYHDFAYMTVDPNVKKEDKKASPILHRWVSACGGVTAAGGSSQLERTAYQWHQKYHEEDKEKAKENNKEEGVKFRSIYKITTKEVFDKDDPDNEEPQRIERSELRPEVREDIKRDGRQSFEGIQRVARSDPDRDDSDVIPNSVFLRYAAGTASQASQRYPWCTNGKASGSAK